MANPFFICFLINFFNLFGPTGLLTITFTRNNVVGHALFAISLSHSREFSIMQLCGGIIPNLTLSFM